MRLAVAIPGLSSLGGAPSVILEIARHFDASIFTLRYLPERSLDGFKNVHIEVPEKRLLRKIPFGKDTFAKLDSLDYFYNLKLDDYDLVNTHGIISNCIRNRNSPVLWYCHTPHRFAYDLHERNVQHLDLPHRIFYETKTLGAKYLDSRLVPKIEYIFTNSSNTKGRVAKYLKRDAEVLHPGVYAQEFSCRGYEQFFLYPSRFVPEKQFEYAIEAFKRFSSGRKGWKLVLCGFFVKGAEGYLEKLKSMCGDSIIIRTDLSKEELHDLYSRCSAVLFPPLDEDFGIVPLEGLASSKPVIAINEGGPKETVSDGKDGFLVNSPEEMAQRMELLAGNPDLCAEMGRAGRRKVLKEFTWEHFLKRFGEKAEELAKG